MAILPARGGRCGPGWPAPCQDANVINVWDPTNLVFYKLTAPGGALSLDTSGTGGNVIGGGGGGCCGVVPGAKGDPGDAGLMGVGVNAYTTLTASFIVPDPTLGAPVVIAVGDTSMWAVGQPIYIGVAGNYQVSAIDSDTVLEVLNLGYENNAGPGTMIAMGLPVVPSGFQGPQGEDGTGVSSVAIQTPSWYTVSGSPLTSAGTIGITPTDGQVANSFLATPDGATGMLSLRTIVVGDLPEIPVDKLEGAVSVANGGTGATSAASAFNALSPATTVGDLISNNGSSNSRVGIGSVGQILTVDPTSSFGFSWKTPTAALTSTRRRVIVSPDVMLVTDQIIGTKLTTPGPVVETLVPAPADGRRVVVKDENGDGATNNVTILAGAGDTIEGVSSVVISTNFGFRELYYDAADHNWFILGRA